MRAGHQPRASELPHEPTQRGWSIRRHRHGVEADGRHRLKPERARAASGPSCSRASEPAAGSVIDLRSFTPARGLPARRFPTTSASTVAGAAPCALVVALPAFRRGADRCGSSEEAMRNSYSYPELDGVENRVAEEAAAYEPEGLPNRLLNAREVAKFVGCHEETVRRAYWRGLLRSQRFGVRGRRFHPEDVLDWIRRGAPTTVS